LTSLPKNAVAERGVLGDQMAANAGGGRGVMVGRDAFVQVEGGRRWRGRAWSARCLLARRKGGRR
jgi:hypothetical protein